MNNVSWPSHDLLQPACSQWVRARCQQTPWFPGPLRDNTLPPLDSEILDVVLFGDFVDQLARFRTWPLRSSYRLWVLGRAVQKVCVEILGFAESEVGVIPRYELFPASPAPREFPLKEDAFTLVYSGRFVSNKNFDLFLRTASALQTRYGMKSMKVRGAGFYPFSPEVLSAQFAYLILKLPWVDPPVLHTNLGTLDWVSAFPEQPVLLSLSSHRREDFGVSVAQAQAAGWPCCLTEWGGHRDVTGPNVIKIPAALAPTSARAINETFDVSGICESILQQWKVSSAKPRAVDQLNPRPITHERLEKLRTPLWDEVEVSTLEQVLSAGAHSDTINKYQAIFGGVS